MQDEKPFRCEAEHCALAYTCKGNLHRHIRSSHPQLYDVMITSKFVHPRAKTKKALSEASSASSMNDSTTTMLASELTFTRIFRCHHQNCKAELSTYEGLSRHQSDIHGKKANKCGIDGCNLTFARKEQLRSHMNRFHDITVEPAKDVWSSELHSQSYLYGPRRKSLKLLSVSDESNSNRNTQTYTDLPS